MYLCSCWVGMHERLGHGSARHPLNVLLIALCAGTGVEEQEGSGAYTSTQYSRKQSVQLCNSRWLPWQGKELTRLLSEEGQRPYMIMRFTGLTACLLHKVPSLLRRGCSCVVFFHLCCCTLMASHYRLCV